MKFQRGLTYFGGSIIILLVFGVIAYVLLPVTIKWQVNGWFEEQDLSSQIEDVEISLLDGEVIIRGFRVDDASTNLLNIGHLLVNINLHDLLTRKLTLEKVNVGQGYLDINRDQEGLMRAAGITLGDKKDVATKNNGNKESGVDENNIWQIVLSEILLSDIRLCYRAEEMASSAAFFSCGRLSAFEWNGVARYTFHADTERALSEMYINSSARLNGFVVEDMISGHILARIDAMQVNDVKIEGINKINFSGAELRHLMYLMPLREEKSTKNYEISINQLKAGSFAVNNINEVNISTLNFGETRLSMLMDSNDSLDVMRFDELAFKQISIAGANQISFEHVDLSNYHALQTSSPAGSKEEPEYIFSSKQFKAKKFTIRELSSISGEALQVAGLNMLIVINPDGLLDLQNTIDRVYPSASVQEKQVAKTSSTRKSDAKPISIKIGELVVDDNSRVVFRDESVKPKFNSDFSDIRLTLREIDMTDEDKKTWVDLSMMVGDQGKVHAKGNMKLFADRPSLDINAGLAGINVGEFDVYANQLLKHKVKSGHMDAKLEVKIEKGQLDSKAKLTLHKFYIEKLDQQDEGQYKEKLGIPLSTALSLLRSRDDSIKIEIPVTGDIESPDFSLGDIIRKFGALAIKEAVIHYYTPFGLVKLLTASFDLATALRFEPVLFEIGQSEIDELDKQQLDKLSVLLLERPNIHLVICGYATRQDFSTMFPGAAKDIKKLQEQKKSKETPGDDAELLVKTEPDVNLREEHREKLEELASNRGKAIKQYLVEQHNIETKRLILCNPKFNYADEGKARVDITI